MESSVDKPKVASNAKVVVYVAIMAALGIALSILSIEIVPLAGSQITLDLSHLGTFLTAIPGGALIGAITGSIVGIYPGFAYGFTHGTLGLVGLVSLPIGKAITGFSSGLLQRYLRRPLISVVVAYVPECLFTIWLFIYIVPLVTLIPPTIAQTIVLGIVAKAWIEILFMAFVMETIFMSRGVCQLLKTIFPNWTYTPLSEL